MTFSIFSTRVETGCCSCGARRPCPPREAHARAARVSPALTGPVREDDHAGAEGLDVETPAAVTTACQSPELAAASARRSGRPVLLVGAAGSVGEDGDAAVEGGRIDEFERARRSGPVKQVAGCAGTEEEGVQPQAQLIEQPGGHQRVRKGAEAILHDVGAGLLPEVADGVDRVVIYDGRVVPLRVGEGR